MSEYSLSNLEPLIVKPGQHIKDALAAHDARRVLDAQSVSIPPLASRMAADPTQDWT